jgi:hypothetical protein
LSLLLRVPEQFGSEVWIADFSVQHANDRHTGNSIGAIVRWREVTRPTKGRTAFRAARSRDLSRHRNREHEARSQRAVLLEPQIAALRAGEAATQGETETNPGS